MHYINILYSSLWSVWEDIVTILMSIDEWWADYWAACQGEWGVHMYSTIFTQQLNSWLVSLYRKIGLYTFSICSQSRSRMRLLLVTVMGTFLAAVSHRSCVNRLFTAVLTCMLRCNRNVTKWQRHSLSSLPELLCIHIQSATNMSSSSDPPSVQVQVRYFYCQCVVSTYKHVWWLWVLTSMYGILVPAMHCTYTAVDTFL